MRGLPLDLGTIHFVGIGGIGMSGIAEVMHNLGYSVQGSDRAFDLGKQRDLAATLTTDEVYQAFLGAYEEFKTFFHGPSYTGNPLGCAVALANRWAEWFEGLTITVEDNGETLLAGPVVDQAALHGLLKKVRDLGLPLLLVKRTDTSSEPK